MSHKSCPLPSCKIDSVNVNKNGVAVLTTVLYCSIEQEYRGGRKNENLLLVVATKSFNDKTHNNSNDE